MVGIIFIASYSVVAVGLLLFFIRKSLQHETSLKKNILSWVFFGFLFNLFSFSWLYTAYPLIWLREGPLQLIGIGLLHLIVASISGCCFFVVAYTFETRISRRIHTHLKPLVFALSLTFAEVLRALAISVLYYGEGTTIDLNYAGSMLGNALSATPFVEYAYYGGTFALTCILGYLVYSVSSKKNIKSYWPHIVMICLLLIYIHYQVPAFGPHTKMRVSVVTTNFPSPTKDQNISEMFKVRSKKIHQMTMTLSSSSPTIIVYPEGSGYITNLPESSKKELNQYFSKTLFIDADITLYNDKLANATLFYLTQGEKEIRRGKSFLFPFNEYVPYIFMPIFKLFISSDQMDQFTSWHSYTPMQSVKTIPFGEDGISTLLCYEITSFRVLHDIKKEKPSLVFFQSHSNIFHNNSWFTMHYYLYAKTAAAQLRRPLISSVNGSPSYIISPYGEIIKIIPVGFSTSTYIFYKR